MNVAAVEIWSGVARHIVRVRRASPLPFGDFTMLITMSKRCASEFEHSACVALASLSGPTGEPLKYVVGGQPLEWIIWRYDDSCVDEQLQLDRFTIEVKPMVNQPHHIFRNYGRLVSAPALSTFQGTISWFALSGRADVQRSVGST
jgi:hypothetical protein